MLAAMNAATGVASAIAGLPNTIASLPGSSSALASTTGAGGGSAPFSDLLTDAVGQVNQLQDQAQAAVSGLMTGSGVDVHQATIATEKASMAFELSLAVRNKAVQAYQQVMSMQF